MNSNLGGLSFYEDSDGNKYVVGADSVPKKLGSRIIYLGVGTSFDIKKLYPEIDYSRLTNNNFFIEAQSMESTNGATSSTLSMYTRQVAEYTASKKSYNQSTGILTVTQAVATARTTNDKSFFATVSASSKVYMVI